MADFNHGPCKWFEHTTSTLCCTVHPHGPVEIACRLTNVLANTQYLRAWSWSGTWKFRFNYLVSFVYRLIVFFWDAFCSCAPFGVEISQHTRDLLILTFFICKYGVWRIPNCFKYSSALIQVCLGRNPSWFSRQFSVIASEVLKSNSNCLELFQTIDFNHF